ncbi:uncharacterized protein DUF4244 [Humibacillus xanthopallidus]|uniref:Uncharacterized protein DUF4244 n=1 Tax=Humibacillus xanthopallidus TaxID=412689 RepID=A0A543PMI6_9MICO|nr:DUF4244 domain-containing protein [Humibacillus xanthopallidus]TQN45276.1 uncharacterized protein DUF4244 [Humibacillus xanthopallidus]HET7799115.1 DUF4244 domain-containing protein [Humibacillus xanthopallidus]
MTHRNITSRVIRPRGGDWTRTSRRTWRRILRRAEAGMTTAEYAVGIMAACTFALVLLGVVRSDAVRGALAGLVQSALGLAG